MIIPFFVKVSPAASVKSVASKSLVKGALLPKLRVSWKSGGRT